MKTHASALHMRGEGGFSLVELMVAVAVGLLLVSGLALLFANSSQSASELDKSARQIESGRYATDLLAEDIAAAGYFGEAAAYTSTATVSPCALSANVVANLEAQRAASPATIPDAVQGLTAAEAAALTCLDNYKPGTPALVLRRLDTTQVTTGSITTGQVYVQSSNNLLDVNATYLAGTDASAFVLHNLDGSINRVRAYLPRIYYLSTCNECGQDAIPTLKRAQLVGDQIVSSPLAEGIEQIGFDFGFDTNNDGAPDVWLGLNGNASAADSATVAALGWGNAVAVRIYLVSRSTEQSTGFTDGRTYSAGTRITTTVTVGPLNDSYKRRAYASTARINTIAGAREHP